MAASNRDDFPEHVRRSLCERVNALCSKPDCRIVTRGPRADTDSSFSIGRACHVHAAAKGGPRWLESQTAEERRALANGVWLCANHGAEVDADDKAFPADDLRRWRAETEAYVRSTVGRVQSNVPDAAQSEEGLIAIGPEVLVFGRIVGHTGRAWQLSMGAFLVGDVHDLYRFADRFDSALQEERYVCMERAGNGGMLLRAPNISAGGATLVTVELEPTPKPRESLERFDAGALGPDLAIDMSLAEPTLDWGRQASGADLVPQRLLIILGGAKGGWRAGDDCGSRIAEWNEKFSGDHIESIIAVEIARLATVPHEDDALAKHGYVAGPPLGFVRRVREVRMMEPTSPNYLMARLSLDIWGVSDTRTFDIPIASSTESLGPAPTPPSLDLY